MNMHAAALRRRLADLVEEYDAKRAAIPEALAAYLRPGGILIAILPAAARYEHGLLSGSWEDLPVGSFSESGTNVNTCILILRRLPDPS
jgi:hypothetical protein